MYGITMPYRVRTNTIPSTPNHPMIKDPYMGYYDE